MRGSWLFPIASATFLPESPEAAVVYQTFFPESAASLYRFLRSNRCLVGWVDRDIQHASYNKSFKSATTVARSKVGQSQSKPYNVYPFILMYSCLSASFTWSYPT